MPAESASNALEPTLALDELSVDRFFLGTPDDVFLDSVPQVEPELGVQVDTLAARRDLANEFRSPAMQRSSSISA